MRQGPDGRERGLLNADGQWIPLSEASPEASDISSTSSSLQTSNEP